MRKHENARNKEREKMFWKLQGKKKAAVMLEA